MNNPHPADAQLPIWARSEALPKAPSGYGWVDLKGKFHHVSTRGELIDAIRSDPTAALVMAWTPDHGHIVLPDELLGAEDAVIEARQRRAQAAWSRAEQNLMRLIVLVGAWIVYLVYRSWDILPPTEPLSVRCELVLQMMLRSVGLGIGLLGFLIFGLIPWYQAKKRLRELGRWSDGERAALIAVLRFETWLDFQKSPMTYLLLGMLSWVGLVQVFAENSIATAGLVKAAYRHGEWWRAFTAPLLHGNLLHFIMNGSALLYLGKRVEVFARWPHLFLVFVFSAFVGSELSARLYDATSVGASGGLMGYLGFLLVFESLHGALVPRSAKRRLLAGVLLTAVIGGIGYRFIDNACHAGGLLAGMLYALIVFPRSSSFHRPMVTIRDRVAGSLGLLILILSAVMAILQMSSGA